MKGRATIAIALALSFLLGAYLMTRFYWPAGNGVDLVGQPIGQDFINIWAGGRLAVQGHIDTLFDFNAYYKAITQLYGHKITSYNWSYPPHALLLYAPFSFPPYMRALALWTTAGLALWLLVYRSYAGRWNAWQVAALLLSPACFMNVTDGQNGFFTTALFIGGLFLLRKRPIVAGILFGLLTFKPQLGIILPFALVALRQWRAIASATITTVVLALGVIAIFGVAAWQNYFEITSPAQFNLLSSADTFYAAMMVSPYTALLMLGLSPPAGLMLHLMFMLTVIGITCQSLRRTDDARRQIFLLCSAVPLVSPYVFNYDLCLLAIPLVCGLTADILPRRRILYLLAWLAPTLGFVLSIGPVRILQIVAPLSLIGIFIAVVTDIERTRPQSGPKQSVSPLLLQED